MVDTNNYDAILDSINSSIVLEIKEIKCLYLNQVAFNWSYDFVQGNILIIQSIDLYQNLLGEN